MGSQEPDAPAPATTHPIDAGATFMAYLFLAVGLTFGILATVFALLPLLDARNPSWLLLGLGLLGWVAAVMGISPLRLPTRDSTVEVGPDGLVFTLRDRTAIELAWTHIAAWGTVPGARAMGVIPTRSLVAWPSENVPPEVSAAAARLWRKRDQAWVVEAVDPEADLIAAFARQVPTLSRGPAASKDQG